MTNRPNFRLFTLMTVLILLTGGLLVACAGEPVTTSTPAEEKEQATIPAENVGEEATEVTEAIEPTQAVEEEATALVEAPSPTPTTPPPSPTPTTPPSPTPSPTVVVSNDSCIECHTDQEQLMAVAEEEETVEVLSEGEG